MKKIQILAAVAATLLSGAALATKPVVTTPVTASYQFGTGTGATTVQVDGKGFETVRNYEVNGIKLSVSAWSISDQKTQFTQSQILGWGGGLGVCNASEGKDCTSPNHTTDSAGSNDYFLLTFNKPVTLTQLKLTPIDDDDKPKNNSADADFVYASGSLSKATLDKLTLAEVLQKLNANGDKSAVMGEEQVAFQDSLVTAKLTIGTAFTSLLIGANDEFDQKDQLDSFFKLFSVSVQEFVKPGSSGVPVPGTLALLGFAALGLGASIRRRQA